MNNLHLSTPLSSRIINHSCPACNYDKAQEYTIHFSVDFKCLRCGFYQTLDGFYGEVLLYMRHQILKLNRRQMGKKMGISPNTIKSYEFKDCSTKGAKKYIEKLKKEVKKMEIKKDQEN